jgi:hypothetical protein
MEPGLGQIWELTWPLEPIATLEPSALDRLRSLGLTFRRSPDFRGAYAWVAAWQGEEFGVRAYDDGIVELRAARDDDVTPAESLKLFLGAAGLDERTVRSVAEEWGAG